VPYALVTIMGSDPDLTSLTDVFVLVIFLNMKKNNLALPGHLKNDLNCQELRFDPKLPPNR
jgi:hypothetical protein